MDSNLLVLFGLGAVLGVVKKPSNLFKNILAALTGLVILPIIFNALSIGYLPLPVLNVQLSIAVQAFLSGLLAVYAYKFLI